MTPDLQKSTMTRNRKNSKNWMTRRDGQHSTLQEGFGSLAMRRNLWGNADSVDNERNGLLP
jgi:hypothetical protein